MKKKFGLLLATVMVLNTVSSMAYGFTNPLKSYNLYEDTHPSSSNTENSDRERGMSEFYENSLSASSSKAKSNSNYSTSTDINDEDITDNVPQRRNDVLRESSRKVYGNPGIPAGWLEGPSFYANPTFESIKEKYRKSDFAGCLQECISYVRQNPNDTLGFYYLAMCYSKVSDKENAIKAYERVIALNANPMIVKYATNGRNCVLGSADETCYPNVNEPDLIYPYANLDTANLTPVDPDTLIHRNLVKLQNKLSPAPKKDDENPNNQEDKDKEENKIILPFGQQDAKLDQFINAPYGNGLSPDLNKEYKQIQLKKIQQNLNNEQVTPENDAHNLKNIQKFDSHKTDSETIKLAYDTPSSDMESFLKDPEYQQSKRELDELRMMLGNNNNSNSDDDLMNLVPYFSDKDKNMSPEMIEAMMVKSMMPDFTFVNNNKNLL